jgi:hypothetical protein
MPPPSPTATSVRAAPPPRTRRPVPRARNSSLSSPLAETISSDSMAVRSSSPTKRLASLSSPTIRQRLTACGTPSSATAARKVCAVVQRPLGLFVADHAACTVGRDPGPGSRCRQARDECDDDDAKDRHRRDRGCSSRLIPPKRNQSTCRGDM